MLTNGQHPTTYVYIYTALYIPPKQSQAFNQGGTFLFDGEETIFAHYDASTGAHSNIQEVIDLAKEQRVSQSNKATTVQAQKA
jgi:hypothetical protein